MRIVTAAGLAAHDAQRALEPAGAARLGAALRGLLGRGPVLDLGVGSGATARHLVAAGVPVLGVDLAMAMLAGRRVQSPGLPAVAGDLTALPFRHGCVRAAHMSYVLHHVPDWQAGLAEASRVLAAEAVLAVTLGPGPPPPGEPPARRAQLLAWAEAELRLLRPGRRKPLQQMTTLRAVEEVDAALVGSGFGPPELVEVDGGVRRLSTRQVAQHLRDSPFLWAPDLDGEALARATAAALARAEREWGDLDVPLELPVILRYRVYRR